MLPIAVPVPTFRRRDGEIDRAITSLYAQRLQATWVRSIIIAGPAALGEECTAVERAKQTMIWLEHADKSRLVLACWEPDDFRFAAEHEIRPLGMLRAETTEDLARTTVHLPQGAIAYANPRYSRALFTATVLTDLASSGDLPAAVKVSKVTRHEIAELRAIGGGGLEIWHGSSRNIAASLDAGADVVVAPPLAALPHLWPVPTISAVQRATDELQLGLDSQPNHLARVIAVSGMARNHLASLNGSDSDTTP